MPKVYLDIHGDEELRKEIRNMIIGQVKAIVREEFVEIVKVEIERKIDSVSLSHYEVKRLIQQKLLEPGIAGEFKKVVNTVAKDITESRVSSIANERAIAWADGTGRKQMTKVAQELFSGMSISVELTKGK